MSAQIRPVWSELRRVTPRLVVVMDDGDAVGGAYLELSVGLQHEFEAVLVHEGVMTAAGQHQGLAGVRVDVRLAAIRCSLRTSTSPSPSVYAVPRPSRVRCAATGKCLHDVLQAVGGSSSPS